MSASIYKDAIIIGEHERNHDTITLSNSGADISAHASQCLSVDALISNDVTAEVRRHQCDVTGAPSRHELKSRGDSGDKGSSPSECRVWDDNANCPSAFQKTPLRIHQNTPFQAKNSTFSSEKGLYSSRNTAPVDPTLRPQPSRLDPPLRPQNSRQTGALAQQDTSES